jgi:hypothetical protein
LPNPDPAGIRNIVGPLNQGILSRISIDFSRNTPQSIAPLHGVSGGRSGRSPFSILQKKLGHNLVKGFTFKGSAIPGSLESGIVNCQLNSMNSHGNLSP